MAKAIKYFDEVLVLYRNEPFEELVEPAEVFACLDDRDAMCVDFRRFYDKFYEWVIEI